MILESGKKIQLETPLDLALENQWEETSLLNCF